MTRKGKALLDKLELIAIEVNREIMHGITADEEQYLIKVLTKMKHNLKAMDAVPTSTTGRRAA